MTRFDLLALMSAILRSNGMSPINALQEARQLFNMVARIVNEP